MAASWACIDAINRNSSAITVLFTLALVAVGMFQGLIYTGQLFSMRVSTYMTRKLWETDHRPYVTIGKTTVFDANDTQANIDSGRGPQPWQSVAASISISNTGTSPAQNMAFHRHIVFDTKNPKGMPDFFIDQVAGEETEPNPRKMGQTLNVGETRVLTAFAMPQLPLRTGFLCLPRRRTKVGRSIPNNYLWSHILPRSVRKQILYAHIYGPVSRTRHQLPRQG